MKVWLYVWVWQVWVWQVMILYWLIRFVPGVLVTLFDTEFTLRTPLFSTECCLP